MGHPPDAWQCCEGNRFIFTAVVVVVVVQVFVPSRPVQILQALSLPPSMSQGITEALVCCLTRDKRSALLPHAPASTTNTTTTLPQDHTSTSWGRWCVGM
ncbi:hypothetical protein E2C01_029662 [Portunus trituberculatus]|uniref:Uncharacterized protein n=1 Tax=Portunus trituberculatus TaxID=210409 RepID=A0A5B7ETJ1_PORTR|nr:hypothetical protein [Portunus trituberculatus]